MATVTYFIDSNEFFNFKTESTIMDAINAALGRHGAAVSVERPMFSQTLVVQVMLPAGAKEANIRALLLDGLRGIGYDEAEITRVEGGAQTTSLGKEVAHGIAAAASPVTAPIVSYTKTVLFGVVLVLVLYLLATLRR